MSEKLNQLKEYLLSQGSMAVAFSGGLNREVPILVSTLLDKNGLIRSLKIDEQSEGSQGRRCDFACLETLCGEKLVGTPLAELGSRVSSAPDVKCLHLFEILSACASFFGLKGRVRFFNSPSMVGLFLLTISHSFVPGLVSRAWRIEKILHYLQTGYGKNPCKGFGR